MSPFEKIRLDSWWEHKLSPILATVYATAALSQIPFSSLWPVVSLALLALALCAVYVSILNDLTDVNDDRASGKPDRWSGGSRIYPTLLLAACVAAGTGFLIVWRTDALVFGTYLGCWLAFALYSVPPCRLKSRGIWGVLADAFGAHLFPTLFGLFLAYHSTQAEVGTRWAVLVALWSFAAGVRGIISHQLADVLNDEKIGLRTFVALHGTETAARLGLFAFLLEGLAFAAMLWLAANALAWLFLAFYGAFALIRRRLLGVSLAIVEPHPASRVALSEYYIILYPQAFLLTASWQQPWALLLWLFHSALFFRHALFLVHEVVVMLRMYKPGTRPQTAGLPK